MNVWHAFWKFQKAKNFLEFNAFFSAQKWMCGMLFENSKKQKFLLKFTHFFQLKNECVACFLKIRPCVTCFLVMLFEKSSMCDMLFEKKSSMLFGFFEKARNFSWFFLKLDFFSIWQVDTSFMYVENYFPNTSFIYLLDYNTLI